VLQAFGSGRLSQLAGGAVAPVLVLSSASVARGSAGYIRELIDLPATLLVFALVAAALWRLHVVAPKGHGYRAPGLVPPLAMAASLLRAFAALLY
jgi:hypothetical protein